MEPYITLITTCQERNKNYNIQVRKDALVKDLIDQLTILLDLSTNESISVVCNGITLNQNSTFQELQVAKGANIQVNLQHRGGMIN